MSNAPINPYDPGSLVVSPQEELWYKRLRRDVRNALILGFVSIGASAVCGLFGLALSPLDYRAAGIAQMQIARHKLDNSDLGKKAAKAEWLAIAGVVVATINLIVAAIIALFARGA
jgi:hypothetical protein